MKIGKQELKVLVEGKYYTLYQLLFDKPEEAFFSKPDLSYNFYIYNRELKCFEYVHNLLYAAKAQFFSLEKVSEMDVKGIAEEIFFTPAGTLVDPNKLN